MNVKIYGSDSRLLIFIAATNRINDMDRAVLRRFDRIIELGLPTNDTRREIIRDSLKNIDHSLTGGQIVALSKQTTGWSGSDIKLLLR
mmetsp:Transcript_2719/g.3663  ORF Transcript_2719/g.3663 Transcript_2719/m.3663 type:complete len:88 (+) Transcript_2719:772-1035(+)